MTQHYSVDAVEAGIIRLIADDGSSLVMPRSRFPLEVQEGDVLSRRGDDWFLDDDEKRRRNEDAAGRIEKLAEDDDGGDVAL